MGSWNWLTEASFGTGKLGVSRCQVLSTRVSLYKYYPLPAIRTRKRLMRDVMGAMVRMDMAFRWREDLLAARLQTETGRTIRSGLSSQSKYSQSERLATLRLAGTHTRSCLRTH